MKITKFGTKNALFGYFSVRILKNYFHISNQHPQICHTAKFCEKNNLNLGLKMPYLGIFGLEFKNNIAIFEITTLEFV